MVAFESSDNFASAVILQTFLYGLGIPSTFDYILDPENSRADFKQELNSSRPGAIRREVGTADMKFVP
jgi:hypothetical protein